MLLAIQMLDLDSNSGQCLEESYLFDDDQICSSSLEGVVLLDLDTNVDISSNNARLNRLICTY